MTTDPRDRLVDLLVDSGAIVLGDLVTRSGRPTPYFLDLGRVSRGDRLAALGGLYADVILDRMPDVEVVFGPAYKGITIAAAAAVALAARGRTVGVAFDRKEAKDHGEGGRIVGAELGRGTRTVIVEDVTTAGTSVRATVPLLVEERGADVIGLVVAVDRRERDGDTDRSALGALGADLGIVTAAIATVDEVVERLVGRTDEHGRPLVGPDDLERIARHLETYGAPA
jgi:orotate phosphoribosyltransferase